MGGFRILVINPGSTSTRVAVFEGENPLWKETLSHSVEELAGFPSICDQEEFRTAVVTGLVREREGAGARFDAVSARGGLFRPVPGGTYRVNEAMLADLRAGVGGRHACNLGGIIASRIAGPMGIPAFVVDPPVVDELSDIARVSGHPAFPRRSVFHALNQRAALREAARRLGRQSDRMNAVIAHLGGGISVAAWEGGRAVDVNNALDGEGPFSPERSGTVPAADLARFCLSGNPPLEKVLSMIRGRGGMVAHLGTNDAREVERRIAAGDRQAELVYKAMAYRVAQEIGARAAVLSGRVDVIVLTGGMANSAMFPDWIRSRVAFIAPVMVIPGEREMEALAAGALAVLRGEEPAKHYPP
ncbi:MAG: butyrate kinase [Planctomycetota bacterium]|nr:butyrate kinase [Planctomycetota bacterium]